MIFYPSLPPPLTKVHVPLRSNPGAATGYQDPPEPHRSDADNHRIESGYTMLNQHEPAGGPDGLIFLTTCVRNHAVALPT